MEKAKAGKVAINIPNAEIADFCRKWQIRELALFGSVLRDDFDPEQSDIDVLYSFMPGVMVGWEIFRMAEDIESIFNRKVDLIRKEVIKKSRNPYRKREILDSYEVIYERKP